jgi:hypothetical protein
MSDETAAQFELQVGDLSVSSRGAIGGIVRARLGKAWFPHENWYDVPFGVVRGLTELLEQLLSNEASSGGVWFLDGPYRIEVRTAPAHALDVTFVRTEPEVAVEARGRVPESVVLAEVVHAADLLLEFSRGRGFTNESDIEALSAASSWLAHRREIGRH